MTRGNAHIPLTELDDGSRYAEYDDEMRLFLIMCDEARKDAAEERAELQREQLKRNWWGAVQCPGRDERPFLVKLVMFVPDFVVYLACSVMAVAWCVAHPHEYPPHDRSLR